ncbi:MAG: hypothetical protein LAN84_08390 [Acidobacteriia bacterium]|nr:hypothetical protein [Terriglobia bacterium]
MNSAPVKVLLVGEHPTGYSFLSQRLEKRGCECRVATSNSDGARLFRELPFDLILCCDSRDGIGPLVASTLGSSASLFRSHRVENGCLWLPAVLHGQECPGAPALQPREFTKVLDQLVEMIKSAGDSRELAHS